MRVWAMSAVLFLAPVRVFAHDEAAEMGHHWAIPGYLGEIHFQLMAMAAAVCAYILFTYLARARRRGSAGR